MANFFYSLVQAFFFLGVTVAVTVLGILFVKRFRGQFGGDEPPTSDMITNFREMHVRGDLSDDEYRTIKTVLATKFQRESRDSGDKE